MCEYDWITCVLKFFAILLMIDVLWKLLEVFFYGEVQPRKVDDIIAFLWAMTIMYKMK